MGPSKGSKGCVVRVGGVGSKGRVVRVRGVGLKGCVDGDGEGGVGWE